ncbi:hypothetical protein HYW17_00115 [Candidatus Uhrbacteria bacterium]|nr:hypothetical protein [Candidatus Uhrbacteria bacterium]
MRNGETPRPKEILTASDNKIPKGIERMMADTLGVRFGQFLECALSLEDLPDPKKDEDAYGAAYENLVERLEKASAQEIVEYVRGRVAHAIETQQYDEGRAVARFAGMGDELMRINQAWLADLYKRWQDAKDQKTRRKIYNEFNASWPYAVEENNPQAKVLREWKALDDIRELYRFKRKVKSGEALEGALAVLERSKIKLRNLDPKLFAQVHADAVKDVERVATMRRFAPEQDAQKARRLIEQYLEIGVFDFEQDEDLIDRFTQTQ